MWSDETEVEARKVCVDVGGHIYYTLNSTLRIIPYFRTCLKEEDEYIFVDRDGYTFGVILNYVRTGRLFCTSEDRVFVDLLKCEAQYYGVSALTSYLNKMPLTSPNQDLIAELKAIRNQLSGGSRSRARNNISESW